MPDVPDGVVEQYLESLIAHDWDRFAACLHDDFTRVGPYGDTYSSKADYVAYLSAMMPTLPGYSMEVTRITYGDSVAYAELAETMSDDQGPLRTPECITFDLAADGRITRIEVFIQTWPRTA